MICEKSDSGSISLCASILKSGKIAILPTDTVYGFSGIVDLKGQNVFNTDSAIRTIKGRSERKPLICLLPDVTELKKYTDDIIPQKILNAWPGALTLIVHIREDNPLAFRATTLAFRIPGDEWIRDVIAQCGAPIYSTSVNRSGNPVLENIEEIEKEFSDDVDLIVRDGNKNGAKPSTLVALEKDGEITILRQGAVQIA